MYDLTFDPEKYEIKTCELGNRSITYRAFEHIVYGVGKGNERE